MIKRRRPDNRPQARIVATMAMSVSSALPFDVARVRSDFPALAQRVNGHPLVYLSFANGDATHVDCYYCSRRFAKPGHRQATVPAPAPR